MSVSAECSCFSRSALPSVNWNNEVDRRVIMASLVEGVYNIEYDRLDKNRYGHQHERSRWWESFDFKLKKEIIEKDSGSVIGCIYESTKFCDQNGRPTIVISFRGTIMKKGIVLRDIKDDLKTFFQKLDKSPRFPPAIAAVEEEVRKVGSRNVYLTGHSLGSSLALLVGKVMADKDHFLQTYLFNPPFLSVTEEIFNNHQTLKLGFHAAHSVIKAAAAAFTLVVMGNDHIQEEHIRFRKHSNWIPNLYVNEDDTICSGYIGYFGGRKKMRFVELEKIATQTCVRSSVKVAVGIKSQPLHLLPSANLFINRTTRDPNADRCSNFRKAHENLQWRDPNLSPECERHLFSEFDK